MRFCCCFPHLKRSQHTFPENVLGDAKTFRFNEFAVYAISSEWPTTGSEHSVAPIDDAQSVVEFDDYHVLVRAVGVRWGDQEGKCG
jgi:hypothetical protein